MGEIFEQSFPATALEWTGERLTAGAGSQVEIEHLHRYMLARDFCRGRDVLDVASGEGYGTALLAQVAKSATGVEISPEAAGHAAREYRAPNLRFLQGDARAIPLADQSVDVVTSFETIEHFFDHDTFLAEVRRVLRPGGLFLVSSPDRDVYSPPGSPANAYHVRELSRTEFATLLGGAFQHVQLLSQRPMIGSALLSEAQDTGPTVTIERRGPHHFERSDGLPRSVYLVALASDAALPPPPNSVFIESDSVGPTLARAAGHDPAMAALAETRHRAEAAETAFHASRDEIARAMREAADEREQAAARLADAQRRVDAAERALHESHEELAGVRAAMEAAAALASGHTEADEAATAAAAAAAAEELEATRTALRTACSQRDVARLALRRAAVFAENAWQERLARCQDQVTGLQQQVTRLQDEAVAALQDRDGWQARYYGLRARLDRLLRRFLVLQMARLVPRSVRRYLRDRVMPGRRP